MKTNPTWPLTIRLIHWYMAGVLFLDVVFLEAGEQAHKLAGLSLAAVVCVRLGLCWLSTNTAYRLNWPGLAALKNQIKTRRVHYIHHSPLGSLMIISLWCCVLAAAGSGYMQTTDMFWGEEWVELMHSFFVYSLFGLILIHISAIIYMQKIAKLNLIQRIWRG
jgi:cytochrome b